MVKSVARACPPSSLRWLALGVRRQTGKSWSDVLIRVLRPRRLLLAAVWNLRLRGGCEEPALMAKAALLRIMSIYID